MPSPMPKPLSGEVQSQMKRQARRDTKPEMAVRRRLHALGFRYRVNYSVPGMRRRTIDVAFPRDQLAVFVDGCFWHGCPDHGASPKNNAEWWATKISMNKARDAETAEFLRDHGWNAVRIWEHQQPDEAVMQVVQALTELRALRRRDTPAEEKH